MSSGGVALYDAIEHGLNYAVRGRHDVRALIVVSRRGDNASRSTLQQLSDRLTASPTEVDAIAITDTPSGKNDSGVLAGLAALTGGEAVFLNDPAELESTLDRLAWHLGTVYSLGFTPTELADVTRYRPIDIQLAKPIPDASLKYRPGYVGGCR